MEHPHVPALGGESVQRRQHTGAFTGEGARRVDRRRALHGLQQPGGDLRLRLLVGADRGAGVPGEGPQDEPQGGQPGQHAGGHPQVDHGQRRQRAHGRGHRGRQRRPGRRGGSGVCGVQGQPGPDVPRRVRPCAVRYGSQEAVEGTGADGRRPGGVAASGEQGGEAVEQQLAHEERGAQHQPASRGTGGAAVAQEQIQRAAEDVGLDHGHRGRRDRAQQHQRFGGAARSRAAGCAAFLTRAPCPGPARRHQPASFRASHRVGTPAARPAGRGVRACGYRRPGRKPGAPVPGGRAHRVTAVAGPCVSYRS